MSGLSDAGVTRCNGDWCIQMSLGGSIS